MIIIVPPSLNVPSSFYNMNLFSPRHYSLRMAHKFHVVFQLQLVHNDCLELYVKKDSDALCGLNRKEYENKLLVFSYNGEMVMLMP